MGPALMEGIERTNAVVVRGQGQGVGVPPRRDPFAMDIDRGRNCYACEGFGHMACHCKNRRQRGRVADNGRPCARTLHRHSNFFLYQCP